MCSRYMIMIGYAFPVMNQILESLFCSYYKQNRTLSNYIEYVMAGELGHE
jgi:hypothetical protein